MKGASGALAGPGELAEERFARHLCLPHARWWGGRTGVGGCLSSSLRVPGVGQPCLSWADLFRGQLPGPSRNGSEAAQGLLAAPPPDRPTLLRSVQREERVDVYDRNQGFPTGFKIHTCISFKTKSYTLLIKVAAAAAAKSLRSCPTLWDPIDGSPPGSPVPGILQARTLEWGAISCSTAWKWKVKVKLFSHVQLLVIPWTAAYQAPLSMGFARQEYWSGVPLHRS